MGKVKYIAKCIDCSTVVSRYAKRCKLCKVKAGKARKTCTCNKCGKEYVNKRSHGDEGTKYCSRECAYKDKAGSYLKHGHKKPEVHRTAKPKSTNIYFRSCVSCSKSFVTRWPNQKSCTKDCAYSDILSRLRVEYNPVATEDKKCVVCGGLFNGHKINKYCSANCRKSTKDRGNGKRRAIKFNVAYEYINKKKVFIRDGWRCQICGKKTPEKSMGRGKTNSPELDHRIPISKGGGHTYNNTQCACRKCNGKKSNRTNAGQMPLFMV